MCQAPADKAESAQREMNQSIAFVLAAYGVTKLKCDGFTVEVTDWHRTRKGQYPVIRIRPEKHSGTGYCPYCGWPPGRWLRGQGAHSVTWCPGCTKLYYRDLIEEWGF